jgi:Ice-binding-like/HYR domain
MNEVRRLLLPLFLAALVVAVSPLTALAATDPLLGTSGNYAVLAAATITNTGPSWITGQLALSPGTSVTGFPPGTVGHEDIANGAALQAKNDARAAYNNAAGEPGCTSTGVELGSRTLGPGLYCNPTMGISAGLTLTLSGGGIYIFQVGSTLITGASSRVLLTNGAQPCDIFWQVGSSATIGGSTAFVGTILANASITMITAATLNGRALAGLIAPTGALTLNTNRIIQPSGCIGGFTTSYPAPAFVPPPAGGGLDKTPPILSLPGNLTVDATGPAGAVVTYTVTATDPDNSPSSLTLTCAPASGSTFPIGTTTVNCSAVDPAGNQAVGSFTVTVLGAAVQLSNLIATVDGFNLQPGVSNSFDAKLAAANDSAVQRPNTAAACNQLGAFINEAQAQSGNMLTAQQANQLIAAAAQVQATLGC